MIQDIELRFNSAKLSAIRLKAAKDNAITNLRNLQQTLVLLNEELTKLNESKESLLGAIEIIKQLIDVMSQEQINQLKDLLSYALKTIFDDRDYAVDIVISESRNTKQANFFLIENLADDSVLKSDFRDAIGGGILAVVGLIIQVYYILYYEQNPIIFMDEALSQISSQYLPNVLLFIDELAKKKNFKFVLISHDERLIEYGNTVYTVSAGEVTKVR